MASSEEWLDPSCVGAYRKRADEFPHRLERKRELYGEVLELLEPGGVLANFEHVASPTPGLHAAFFAAIDEPLENEDPSDRTLDVETQLGWLRELGFDDVDCYWKWLEMALLIGVKPL
jgi:tRNA (cmo5U34)-methyltransferase